MEKQKRDDEQKKKEKEDWKKKMIVEDPTFHVSLRGAKAGPLWSLTGLLQDPVKKLTLKMPQRYIRDKVVKRDKVLLAPPISFNMAEEKMTKGEMMKKVELGRKFDKNSSIVAQDFNTIPLNPLSKETVYKPSRADAFTDKYT